MGCECCKQPPTGESAPLTTTSAGSGQVKPGDSETIRFLSKVKLFKRLPEEFMPMLVSAVVPGEFKAQSTIIRQGDYDKDFYIIKSGTVRVEIDGNKVATCESGDYFGEVALLRDEPRAATVVAEVDVQVLKITREKFQDLGLNEKLEFAKRQAVGGGGTVETKPPSSKTPGDRTVMADAIKKNKNLTDMVALDDKKIQMLIDVAWEESVSAGQELITQGMDGDYFYIVKEGSFEILINKDDSGKGANDLAAQMTERVGNVPKGGSFGELALLYFAPRAATVKARERATVWVMDRNNWKNIFAKSAEDFAKDNLKYLEKDVFKELKNDEKLEVAKSLTECVFSKGEFIFEQGEAGTAFYILIEGDVSVIKDGKEVNKLSGGKMDIFGELALINAEKRQASIKALTDVKMLTMDKASFDLLLGPLSEIKKRGKEGGQSKVGKGRQSTLATEVQTKVEAQVKQKIYRKDLTKLGLLGCGGFGAVELVEHNKTKDTYALKALSKGYVLKCGMTKGVMSEKNIQFMCDSDFVVRLFETYNGEQSLYFLLELCLGGELYATYSKKGFHGSVKHAQFYIGGTVYAFEHLHSKKIIFRDLKPENLLLTEKGHIKLTDMGLAKVVVGKTYTTCGTPDYFAPELIASSGHTHAVDWWCLGILTFELMTGHPPFESAAPMQIYSKVTKGINKVSFPPKIKGPCEDLVKSLCKKEPSDRLPMKKGGIENIQKHAWYKNFDWAAMRECKDPPYLPKVKSKKDIANFSARKEDMPPQIKYKDPGTGWDKDFATSS
mmetsp:Transcript_37562/g.60197  ORF Transcript_37562/g.60197 Transcript_37562/m.60197 type:complete len:782 (+) Transcript_37562:65-2410(+)